MEIVEEQHWRLEEVRMNLTTPLTCEGEASEPENFAGARLKITSRASLTLLLLILCLMRWWPQTYSHHSYLRT